MTNTNQPDATLARLMRARAALWELYTEDYNTLPNEITAWAAGGVQALQAPIVELGGESWEHITRMGGTE